MCVPEHEVHLRYIKLEEEEALQTAEGDGR
jgi:hypothetical protein